MNAFRALNQRLVSSPKAVVAVTLALALVAAIPVSRLPLRTGRLDLVPAGDPTVAAFQDFGRRHGSVHSMFLLVRGPQAAAVKAATQAAATALSASDLARAVLHRLDLDRSAAGLILALEAQSPGTVAPLAGLAAPVLAQVATDPTPAGLFDAVAGELSDEETPAPPVTVARLLVAGLCVAVEHVADGQPPSARREGDLYDMLRDLGLGPPPQGIDGEGYLASDQGRAQLLVITPGRAVETPELAENWMNAADELLRPARRAHPDVTFDWGGLPAQDAQEHRTVQSDMARTSTVAAALVLALSLFAFGNARAAIAVNVILALAVHFTLAAAALLVGYLNVISGVFVAVLVGMGIDFGIYLHQLYREALCRTPDPGLALDAALREGSTGIVTGALTPTAAFFALSLHRFPAFRELGIVAGTGILICLAMMLIVWPAVLRLGGLRLASAAPPEPVGLGRLLVAVARGRPWLVGGVTMVCAVGLALVPPAPFDFDTANLQDSTAPAHRVEAFMREAFGLSSDFMMVSSPSLAQARKVAFLLARSPLVKRVDSAGMLLAQGPSSVGAAHPLDALRSLSAVTAASPDRVHALPTAQAARALASALKRLSDLGQVMDDQPLLTSVVLLRGKLDALATTLDNGGPRAEQTVATAAAHMVDTMTVARIRLARVMAAEPYTARDLPPILAARYLGNDGSLATYAWPARNLGRETNAREFLAAVNLAAGTSSTAGTPAMVYRMLGLIQTGFTQAAMLALGAVIVTVSLDLRHPLLMFFGLIPMLLGTLVTTGILSLTGRSWNVVNAMAVPVMLGEGVGFGINLVHRWRRDGSVDDAVAGLGRAVLFCAATTVAGFGSLMAARHRGLSSFGGLMVVGTVAALFAAIVVLPRLLRLVRPPVRR